MLPFFLANCNTLFLRKDAPLKDRSVIEHSTLVPVCYSMNFLTTLSTSGNKCYGAETTQPTLLSKETDGHNVSSWQRPIIPRTVTVNLLIRLILLNKVFIEHK